MNLDQLQPGKKYDLKGLHIAIKKPLLVPPGCVTVYNGKIDFQGNGATVGSASMSPFYTNAKSGQLHLENLNLNIAPDCAVVHTDTGGRVSLKNVIHYAGAIVWSMGAELVEIVNCWAMDVPEKYWFANFTHELKNLIIDNAHCPHAIKQGQHEAAIRLMQVDNATITGLHVIGSFFKQAVQDRPGGRGKPRDSFAQHVWRNCKITGGVDLGNIKLPTDVNFPFGTLSLSKWDGCDVDHFTYTDGGKNGLTWDEMGIRCIQFTNTKIAGKPTTQTVTK